MTSLWHSSNPDTPISLQRPLSYADRLRIRQPGDAKFSLGPHADGGSVERWEADGYGRGGVYDAVFRGEWEAYDPWEAAGRVDAVTDLYGGLGSCSMFRMFQGWLSMSATGPGEGTLLVNPLVKESTVYSLLRPFFRPVRSAAEVGDAKRFLDVDNWEFTAGDKMTSDLQGATPGHGQEFPEGLHPHLELEKTMVHVPKVAPGDYVIWHCDGKCGTSIFARHLLLYHMLTYQLSHPRCRSATQWHVGRQCLVHTRLSDNRGECEVRGAAAGCLFGRHTSVRLPRRPRGIGASQQADGRTPCGVGPRGRSVPRAREARDAKRGQRWGRGGGKTGQQSFGLFVKNGWRGFFGGISVSFLECICGNTATTQNSRCCDFLQEWQRPLLSVCHQRPQLSLPCNQAPGHGICCGEGQGPCRLDFSARRGRWLVRLELSAFEEESESPRRLGVSHRLHVSSCCLESGMTVRICIINPTCSLSFGNVACGP